MRKKIFTTFAIVAFVLISMKIVFFKGFNGSDFEGLILNLLTEVIGIILAFIFIDHYLEQLESKRRNIFIRETVHNEYKQMILQMSQVYINFVTKNPPKSLQGEENVLGALDRSIDNINQYVHNNFLRHKIKSYSPNTDGNGNITTVVNEYSYEQYCVRFKEFSTAKIEAFLLKYISKIPDDVVTELSNMKNVLLSPVLTTGLENGIEIIGFENATFNPEHFKTPLVDYGESLQRLAKFID